MNDRLGLIGAGSVDKGVCNVNLLLYSLLRFGIRVLEGCTGFFGIENHALIISSFEL